MLTGMTAIERVIFLHDVLRGGRPLSERRRSHGPRVGWPKLHIRKCEDMSAWPPVPRCQCLRALAELGS